MSANSELQSQIAYLERSKGIDHAVLMEALKRSLLKSAQKVYGPDCRVEINEGKGGNLFNVYRTRVVSNDTKGTGFISLRLAQMKYKPDAQLGDAIEILVPAEDLGRIAIQVFKQTLIQAINEVMREKVCEKYKNEVGKLVSGTVKSIVRRDVYVDLGDAEAVLRERDAIPGESFEVGKPIKAILHRVQGARPKAGEIAEDSTGPGLILSRRSPELVKALFSKECSEVGDGTVEILGVAREAGFRSKIAVRAFDEKIDPVGACVGVRGARVKTIVEELHGEKVDIIPWSEDFYEFVREALKPAQVLEIRLEEVPATESEKRNAPYLVSANGTVRIVHAIIDSDQYSLTIGRRGMNIRLTADILNVRTVDIRKSLPEPTVEERYHDAIDDLAMLPGVTRDQAQQLVDAGYLSIDGILEPANDFRNAAVTDSGFEPAFVEAVWTAAMAWHDKNVAEDASDASAQAPSSSAEPSTPDSTL